MFICMPLLFTISHMVMHISCFSQDSYLVCVSVYVLRFIDLFPTTEIDLMSC